MNYQGRAILASVVFALLVYFLLETQTDIHQRMQVVLVLHPLIVLMIVIQMALAIFALYMHHKPQYRKNLLNYIPPCISLLFVFYIVWLCYH